MITRSAATTLVALGLALGVPAVGQSEKRPSPFPSGMVLPAGTTIQVRMDQSLDTARNRAGDRFAATLNAPARLNGKVVLPKGTRFRGRVTDARRSGRLRGQGRLGLALESFTLDGKTYRIATTSQGRTTLEKKRKLLWIGGGSGGGALIGGLAAGGPWALAGAGIGAGAGTVAAVLTAKRDVSVPSETVMSFPLRQPLRVTRAARTT